MESSLPGGLMGNSAERTAEDVIDVFLCHNSADKQWVERLAQHIESETVDGTDNGRPLRVFFDKWDIDVGQNFVQRINFGLNTRSVRFGGHLSGILGGSLDHI